jgi:hypothetical protein
MSSILNNIQNTNKENFSSSNDSDEGTTEAEDDFYEEDADSEASEEETDTEEVSLEDRPEVQDISQNYLINQWTPWADGERPRRASIKVYSQFFELQRRGEAIGVVLRCE